MKGAILQMYIAEGLESESEVMSWTMHWVTISGQESEKVIFKIKYLNSKSKSKW